MLWATIPSGAAPIVELRRRLSDLVTGPSFASPASSFHLDLIHVDKVQLPIPTTTVYIGIGSPGELPRPSPWCNPFQIFEPEGVHIAKFREYCGLRGDLKEWLWPLFHHRWLCDCRSSHCHGLVLAEFCEALQHTASGLRSTASPLSEEDEDEDSDLSDADVRDIIPASACAKPGTQPPPPPQWIKMKQQIRSYAVRIFWEIFAGSMVLSCAFEREGWAVGPAVDVLSHPSFNLLDPMFVAMVIGLILERRVALLWISPPRTTFCRASTVQYRSKTYPEGLPGLTGQLAVQVSLANALADTTVSLARAQQRTPAAWVIEFQSGSYFVEQPGVVKLRDEVRPHHVVRDACVDGAPWRCPMTLLGSHSELLTLGVRCPGCPRHLPLRGRAPDGRQWYKLAETYWPGFAVAVTRAFARWRECGLLGSPSAAGGLHAVDPSLPLNEAVEEAGFTPSGSRTADGVARKAAAGIQPVRAALPQLIPDGLDPDTHVAVARNLVHPVCRPPPLSKPCAYALQFQIVNSDILNERRSEVCEALKDLDALTQPTCLEALMFIHSWLQPSVSRRNIAFMREVAYLVQGPDFMFLADHLLGLPKVGWICAAPSHLVREAPPSISIEQLYTGRDEHNCQLLKKIGPSSDPALDEASWEKTSAEFKHGVLIGPFWSLAEVPLAAPRLVRRFPIWETHGGCERTCRNIDDMLEGGQNDACGTQWTHVPADLDAWAGLVRAVADLYPDSSLRGHTSDFAKAFRQQTADPQQAHWHVVATWCPDRCQPALGIAVAQLFGGKAAPVNFARIPSWCIYALAFFFSAAYIHCVDDMLSIEREETAYSGYWGWRHFAAFCGWDIPDKKSPPPLPTLRVLGAWCKLSPLPRSPAVLEILPERAQQLRAEVLQVLRDGRLLPGYAARLVGKLGFASTQLFGKYGRAKLRPFVRRQYESSMFGLNPQLRSALQWWAECLLHQFPREIPFRIADENVVVTYSDGEGSMAGIGVIIFSARLSGPEAGMLKVPPELRLRWRQQEERDLLLGRDIFEVEAVGPLILLENWQHCFRHSLWLHFIDNQGALQALVKGSSSIAAGDEIIGLTWSKAAAAKAVPWFERVESKANPSDGLSRGQAHGPWILRQLRFPAALHALLGC